MENVKDEKDLRIEELEQELIVKESKIDDLEFEVAHLKEDNLRLRVKNDMCGAILRGLSEEL